MVDYWCNTHLCDHKCDSQTGKHRPFLLNGDCHSSCCCIVQLADSQELQPLAFHLNPFWVHSPAAFIVPVTDLICVTTLSCCWAVKGIVAAEISTANKAVCFVGFLSGISGVCVCEAAALLAHCTVFAQPVRGNLLVHPGFKVACSHFTSATGAASCSLRQTSVTSLEISTLLVLFLMCLCGREKALW